MRISFAVITLPKGGASRMLAELMEGLARRGHEVTMVISASGVIEFPLSCGIIRTAGEEFQPSDFPYSDVIVSNYYTTVWAAQAACEQGRGMHIRLSLCYEPLFLPNQQSSFYSYQRSPRLLTLSRYQQDLIYLNHGIRSRIVPVGISESFRPYGIRDQNGPLQIGAVVRMPEGGDAWHRQQESLITQLLWARTQRPWVQLNLIGPPREVYRSQALMKLYNSGEFRFYTPGTDAELCYHYNQMHIFVASSVHEAGPLPTLEAMRCGAAIATVYSGGNRDYCVHEHNALMSYAAEGRLGLDIVRLIDDYALRQRLSAAGEADAQAWTWDRSVSLFEQAVHEYLQQG